jgi:hypothetical protein
MSSNIKFSHINLLNGIQLFNYFLIQGYGSAVLYFNLGNRSKSYFSYRPSFITLCWYFQIT